MVVHAYIRTISKERPARSVPEKIRELVDCQNTEHDNIYFALTDGLVLIILPPHDDEEDGHRQEPECKIKIKCVYLVWERE